MAPSQTRKKQLQKLAQRRAAERRRQRRRKVLAAVVAGAVALGGLTFVGFSLLGGDDTGPSDQPTTPPVSPSPTPTVEIVACGGTRPAAAEEEKTMYDKAPPMTIDRNKDYTMTMVTSCGTIELKLFADQAPNTVNSLVFLAKQKFFDGLTFHRIVKDFVIQGGDPIGDGTGGPGYKTVDAPPEGTTYKEGDLAMAKAEQEAPGTAGSQFFVVTGNPAPLNATPVYALVGRVTEGLDVAKTIEQLPALGGATDGAPAQTVYIESVRVHVS